MGTEDEEPSPRMTDRGLGAWEEGAHGLAGALGNGERKRRVVNGVARAGHSGADGKGMAG